MREDRELLAELARLNRELAPLAMRMMEGSANIADQRRYAQRLIAAGERLGRRADGASGAVIEGEILADERLIFPAQTVEPVGSCEYR